MNWLRRNGWLIGLALAVLLPFVVLFSFVGNPISLHLAKKGAEAYVETHYPGWAVTNVGYDFITPTYYAHAEKDSDRFTVHMNGLGEVYFDTHE